jgi:hypothetical protein
MPRLVLKIARWNLIVTCARLFKQKVVLCAQMSRVLWHIPLGVDVYMYKVSMS